MAELIYREEPLSEVTFGPFDSAYFYDIENSKDIWVSRSKVLKSVECVVVKGNNLLFIEAKKTAPKELKSETAIKCLSKMIKPSEYEEYRKLLRSLSVTPAYVANICEKFLVSLCLVLSIAEGRIPSDDMCLSMKEAIRNPSITPVFVLIITWSKKAGRGMYKMLLIWLWENSKKQINQKSLF